MGRVVYQVKMAQQLDSHRAQVWRFVVTPLEDEYSKLENRRKSTCTYGVGASTTMCLICLVPSTALVADERTLSTLAASYRKDLGKEREHCKKGWRELRSLLAQVCF